MQPCNKHDDVDRLRLVQAQLNPVAAIPVTFGITPDLETPAAGNISETRHSLGSSRAEIAWEIGTE
jgi:hypothetical protein